MLRLAALIGAGERCAVEYSNPDAGDANRLHFDDADLLPIEVTQKEDGIVTSQLFRLASMEVLSSFGRTIRLGGRRCQDETPNPGARARALRSRPARAGLSLIGCLPSVESGPGLAAQPASGSPAASTR
jgi:hypothetical protein